MKAIHLRKNNKTYCGIDSTLTTGDISKVTCLRCLDKICRDVRKAYDKQRLMMCVLQKR